MTDPSQHAPTLFSHSRRTVLKGAAGIAASALFDPRAAFADDRPFAGQTLNFIAIQPHAGGVKKLAADFEAATGAKVNTVVVPYEQVATKVALDIQSGANEFDAVTIPYTAIGQLAEEKLVADLTGLIERDAAEIQPDDFIPAIYETYTAYDGRRWALPLDGNSHLLFYNKEILGRNGLKPPTTWDEYDAVAKAVTEAEAKNGIYGAAILGAKTPIIVISTFANRLAGFGGAFLNADGTSALDSEAAIAAARSLPVSVPYALPTPLETRFEEGLPAFLSGKVALIEFWSDLGIFAQDPGGSKIVDKWGVLPIPVGGANTRPRLAYDAGFSLAVSSGSQKPDLAWAFLKFVTSPKVHEETVTQLGSGIDPYRKSTLDSAKFKQIAPAIQPILAESLDDGLAWPSIPVAPRLESILTDELALIFAGQKDPEAAILAAHKAWNEAIADA